MATTSAPATNATVQPTADTLWKPDWLATTQRIIAWWQGKGPLIHVRAPFATPRLDTPEPAQPQGLRERWVDPAYVAQRDLHHLAHAFLGGDVIPNANMCVGAGDLAAMIGCAWEFNPTTVWFEPFIQDPTTQPLLRFDPDSDGFHTLAAMIQHHLHTAAGRYFVGMPDLVENFDILAAARNPQTLMMDLYDDPDWVLRSIDQINDAYFEAFDRFFEMISLPDALGGGHVFGAFSLWGPGRTAKVQCDASSMLSPDMFSRFVTPALDRQCRELDYAMYHLDGEDCFPCLDALLAIESIDAIEWTPRFAYSDQGGGKPMWYDLYRRIKAAGKSVQAICVQPDEVVPLLDAVGPEGMSIFTTAAGEDEAWALVERVDAYRPAS